MPNLCYLRIVACDYDRNVLTSEFEKRAYPQIMSVILPAEAHPLLLALPGLLEIIAKSGPDDAIPRTAAKHCHKVEGIIGIPPWTKETAECKLKAFIMLVFGRRPTFLMLSIYSSRSSNAEPKLCRAHSPLHNGCLDSRAVP